MTKNDLWKYIGYPVIAALVVGSVINSIEWTYPEESVATNAIAYLLRQTIWGLDWLWDRPMHVSGVLCFLLFCDQEARYNEYMWWIPMFGVGLVVHYVFLGESTQLEFKGYFALLNLVTLGCVIWFGIDQHRQEMAALKKEKRESPPPIVPKPVDILPPPRDPDEARKDYRPERRIGLVIAVIGAALVIGGLAIHANAAEAATVRCGEFKGTVVTSLGLHDDQFEDFVITFDRAAEDYREEQNGVRTDTGYTRVEVVESRHDLVVVGIVVAEDPIAMVAHFTYTPVNGIGTYARHRYTDISERHSEVSLFFFGRCTES